MTRDKIEKAIAASVAGIPIKHESAYRAELKKVADLRQREAELSEQAAAVESELLQVRESLKEGWTALREIQESQVAHLIGMDLP